MKDWNEKSISVGDRVIYIDRKYQRFNEGIVKKITPKGITIEYDTLFGKQTTFRREKRFVMKV